MTLAELKDSLALWMRREAERKKLHTVAQQDLLEARTGGASADVIERLEERRDLRSAQLREARDTVKRRIQQIDEAQDKKVRRPFERIKTNVDNQSSRGGAKPRIIVIHSTESHNRAGLTDLQSIVNWFDNPVAQASSHVILDDEGFAARCVADSQKAWTQASFNPISLSIEMIGFASQGKSAWTDAQYKKTAQYLAYWSKKYGIPLERSTSHGVCRHLDLGAAGGGHHDPGVNFDMDRLLSLARKFKTEGW